jgi:hypothetical protein
MDSKEKKKILNAINFLEEFTWLIDSKKNVDLKEIPSLLRRALEKDLVDPTLDATTKYSSTNSNKNYLVGR